MKNNAIIRIVIWSITIVVLLCLLGCALFGFRPLRQVLFTNTNSVSLLEPVSSPSRTTGQLCVQPDAVRDIEIEWVSGNVLIQCADVDSIQISESEVSDEKYQMRLEQQDHKLKISFCEDSKIAFPAFGAKSNLRKDLTILVPRDFTLDSLDVDAASATLEVTDLTIREVEIDTASGKSEFIDCSVWLMDVDTASGDVTFTGSLDMLDCEAASASVKATLRNVPVGLNMDTMSGDIDLTLPKDAGFTVSLDAMSGKFNSDFDTSVRNGSYVCGDGRCKIEMDTMSGKVTVRKGDAAAVQ